MAQLSPSIKKQFYCNNCGISGHLVNKCKEPKTSYGIIVLSLNFDEQIRNKISEYFKINLDTIISDNTSINIETEYDIDIFGYSKNYIKFLLIQRKYTFGYIEFIRGRYDVTNIEEISYLFRQMSLEEIEKLRTDTFENLWNELWGNTRLRYHNEYILSQSKFNKLKDPNGPWMHLDFYVQNIKPYWEYPEWGFPKGRRNKEETNLECALREFTEETGYTSDDIVLFDTAPITEIMNGTDGLPYKHVYYLAMLKSESIIKPSAFILTNTNMLSSTIVQEVRDVQFMTYEDSINTIRPYHTEKQKIITNIYSLIINILIKMMK